MKTAESIEGIVALRDWGVIRAHGADAAHFLNGQLTNDIATLDAAHARLAGYCSAKGRLLASFIVWRTGEEVLLACRADLLAATLKRLAMFVLRARCRLEDASADVPLYGLAGPGALDGTGDAVMHAPWQRVDHEGATLIRLPDGAGRPRLLRAGGAGSAPAPSLPALDPAAWRWLEVQSGVPSIEAATAERFVPQMINFERVGGVSFSKGCYPGQEIVARSQYRGTIKRRGALFDVDAEAHAAQEVFHSDDPGQPAGTVVNAAPRPDGAGSSAFVEIKLAALEGGSLHLGAPDGPVMRQATLPYALHVDDEATA